MIGGWGLKTPRPPIKAVINSFGFWNLFSRAQNYWEFKLPISLERLLFSRKNPLKNESKTRTDFEPNCTSHIGMSREGYGRRIKETRHHVEMDSAFRIYGVDLEERPPK